MTAVLNSVLPLFALVLVGYGAMRFRALSPEGLAGLNRFVYVFALPVMLFFTMARSPLDGLFDWRIVAAYSGASVTVFVAALLLMPLLFPGRSIAERTVVAGAGSFSNIAYLGVPLVIGAFGPGVGAPAGLILLADNLILIPLIMAFLEGSTGSRTSPLRLVGKVLAGFARNPFLLGMLAGAVWGILRLPLPEPVLRFGDLLGGAAGPCALFALGGSLYGRPIAEGRAEVGFASLLKLFAHPALAAVAAFWIFGLPDEIAVLVVAIAALPTGANIFVLASQYEAAVARASTVVLVTTGMAVVTVSGLLLYLAGRT
ncbi:MAG: AEC family transporter [Minwuia sp.]|uniref:AEC family transporter n=1 Tax=Minwuia sp. TaxID=2493630 RepID=UPI003A8A17C6